MQDFFKNREKYWNFQDVVNFIDKNFDSPAGFEFTIGERINSDIENQRAGKVLSYALLMDYTFLQVFALFSEHHHFAISMPEKREGRNILFLFNIYIDLIAKGYDKNIKLSDFPELIKVPNILIPKNK